MKKRPNREVFDWVADELVARTDLSRLEARGTVRLVLRDAGLNPATVAAFQMRIVLTRLMANALEKRKVPNAKEVCAAIAEGLDTLQTPTDEDAYDVFERFDRKGGDE